MGGRVVFSRKSAPSSNRTSEIWVLDLTRGSLAQLTRNEAVDWIPSWSPDGSQITFNTNRDGNYDLWVMNADGTNQRPWITLEAWDEYASWSPDGAQLAFATTDEYQGAWNSEIFVASSNTSRRRVTFNAARDEWPTWSPDGRWLACSSDRDGDLDIYIFSVADGGSVRNWTADTYANVQPNWSPDGEWIAFIRTTDTSDGGEPFGDVWLGRPDGSSFRQLTRDGRSLHVAWSPDGRCLVFSHFKDSTGDGRVTAEDVSDLWVISVDGQQSRILTDGPDLDFASDWAR